VEGKLSQCHVFTINLKEVYYGHDFMYPHHLERDDFLDNEYFNHYAGAIDRFTNDDGTSSLVETDPGFSRLPSQVSCVPRLPSSSMCPPYLLMWLIGVVKPLLYAALYLSPINY